MGAFYFSFQNLANKRVNYALLYCAQLLPVPGFGDFLYHLCHNVTSMRLLYDGAQMFEQQGWLVSRKYS